MIEQKLILLTRVGCCLCEGLEERLRKLSLEQLDTSLTLCVRDIDSKEVTKAEIARYSMEVPVLLLELSPPLRRYELPRVSPRLSDEGLFKWLQKKICEQLNNS